MAKKDIVTKDMSKDELRAKVSELEQEIFKLKLQRATGQLEKTALLKGTRRQIARAKTFMTQKAEQR